MRFSPLNIKRQEFKTSLRGYDKEEVKDFLEQAASDMEELIRENDALKKDLEENKEKLGEFRRIEKSLQDTLLKAQENSARATESAKKQTSLMLKEAEVKANQILEHARNQVGELRSSVVSLREERDLILAKLKAIVNTQSNLLEIKIEDIERDEDFSKRKDNVKKLDVNISDISEKIV
ncbi:MAG TPA: DivIVA domain-containing protein [Ignavibacteriaceae bacterium]|nr:DivIVA domain-containing protein [Ignavibacteriaceae bacterium]